MGCKLTDHPSDRSKRSDGFKNLLNMEIQELSNKIALNPEVISGFEKILGLKFVAGKTSGNLCFADNNNEIRDDFKQVFTSIDLTNYFYAVLHSQPYREQFEQSAAIDFSKVSFSLSSQCAISFFAVEGIVMNFSNDIISLSTGK